MNSRLKFTSLMLLVALLLSAVPALALPTRASAAACYQAGFVADVTVPDGSQFNPDTAFKKTWKLKNIGTCAWSKTDVSMVFDSGSQMGGPASVALAADVPVGGTVDLTVDLKSPNKAGRYIGYWKFKSTKGTIFGIGVNANKAWWVEINVVTTPTGSAALDFTATADKATWSSGAGGLTFPGTEADAKGFALKKDKPKFENNTEGAQAGLLFVPQNITNGFIQARYPSFKVDASDKFQTTVGCEAGATTCYVTYRLDYEVGGVIKTFWSFRERFEGQVYNASIDLAPLAGKDVIFILHVSAAGSPAGDRALWGNPVIIRRGIVPPPPTNTPGGPTVTPTLTQTPSPSTPTIPPSACDKVQYVADVNVPDGTTYQPGATFTKTWRLKNVGTCAWSTSYQLVFFSGEKMGGPASANFPKNVAVGETVDISVNLTAPAAAGSYRGFWMFKNASGALFGLGAQGNKPWWVDIKVAGATVTPGGPTTTPSPTATSGGPTATPVANAAYDFAANACSAAWYSGAGQLPCPGTDGDAKGFVLKLSSSKPETGKSDPRAALLTFPQNVQNSYIQGFYPPFKVQNGDRFRAAIGCENGATNCYAAFRLEYQAGSDPVKVLWGPFLERYEGQVYDVDVDLSPLAGKDVKFVLTVLSAGTAAGDRALWLGPIIYRASGASAVPTNTPAAATATTSASADTFQNAKYNFKFTLPSGGKITSQTDAESRADLPFTAGTNLAEKYLKVKVTENLNPCVSEYAGSENGPAQAVTINNIQFNKQSGTDAGAGNFYDWVAYTTVRNNACIVMLFVLHSNNPGVFTTPPPLFDKTAESAVFDTTMATFNWINP